MYRLIILVESRIRRNVYVRFGGEYLETDHSNMIRRRVLSLLKEVQKVYNQGREYYDALKKVNNLVKDARKVQKTILLVGEITDIYVNSFENMLSDDNFTVEELVAIANGYTKLLNESDDVLQELKGIVNVSTLSLSDKERMEVIDNAYNKMLEYRNLVKYYTNKNISVSLLRAKVKNETQRVLDLYGDENDRYW
ncbi:conjugal transfer protein TraI [Bacteroides sp. UBA939]|uniref:conjugal transfer protein TraI n=1 Tax=Bacteroides sp. UBA939 TaxID=1946092 RepID=UPI0025B9A964|nr:conjugal transfer protein TraI [Bacteroides sp. UBA939]